MEPLTAEEVLQLWERGERLGAADRALVLLARARRGVPAAELDRMTIGQSELALLELRTVTFGGDLVALENCPDCEAFVELTVSPDVLFAMAAPAAATTHVTLNAGGWRLRFRLPALADLKAVQDAVDPADARAILLERCAEEVIEPEGTAVSAARIPEALQDHVGAAMDEADPVAQMMLPLECARCHRTWDGELNVAAFFWREIAAMARRLMGEVDQLASRYGWSESRILQLSAVRRHAYLEGSWA